jgi:hypothetical protein
LVHWGNWRIDGKKNMELSEHTLDLIHEFDAQVNVSQPYDVPHNLEHQRQYFQITSVVIQGLRLSGTLLGSAGDWMTLGSDGYVRMDVRLQIQGTEGAILFVRYFGMAEANARMKQAMKFCTDELRGSANPYALAT